MRPRRPARRSPRASASPSARSPFIFQLPATSCFRSAHFRSSRRWPHRHRREVAAPPGHLYVRRHDHTGHSPRSTAAGAPPPITNRPRPGPASRVSRHDASDPLQGGLHRRQDPVRAVDHLVRVLGHLHPLRSVRTSTRPTRSSPRSASEDIRADELQQALQPTLERLRAQFGGTIDPQQVKQLGIVDTLLGQLIDRSLLDQEGAAARPRSLRRGDPQRDLRQPGVPRPRRQVRPAAVQPGADDEPSDRGAAGGAAAARHSARRPAAGDHRRGRRAATGGRRALSLSQRKAGRRHRRVSGRRRSPISASRATPT